MNTPLKMTHASAPLAHIAGVALFEILIALLVLSIGLLGLATLQSQGLKSSTSATMRTEATFLAMDMTDRMRASLIAPPPPPAAAAPPILPAGYITPAAQSPLTAIPNTCPVAALSPAQDICDWTTAIQAQLGSNTAGAWAASIEAVPLPLPAGIPAGSVIVTIMWDDERTGARGTACSGNSANDMTCFQTVFHP